MTRLGSVLWTTVTVGATVAVLGLLATAAWLSHAPDAALFDRLVELPTVGEHAAAWRAHLWRAQGRDRDGRPLRPGAPGDSATGESASADDSDRDARSDPADVTIDLSKPPPSARPGEPEWVWVLGPRVLHARPSASSAREGRLEGHRRLPRLARRGSWFEVWFQGRAVWVHLPDHQADGAEGAPYGSAAERPGPLPGRPPDPRHLAMALELLGLSVDSGLESPSAASPQPEPQPSSPETLGPYRLYTDLPADRAATIVFLDRVARGVEPTYRARYGVTPVDSAREAVALFAERSAYDALQAEAREIAGIEASGHAARGLVAIWARDGAGADGGGRWRSRDDLGATLVHEIAHLLNRRALGPALPLWIEEGLAEDLGSLALDADGRLDPRGLAGDRNSRTIGDLGLGGGTRRVDFSGGWAGLFRLHEAQRDGSLRTLEELAGEATERFVRTEARANYDLAAAWVRFLIDGRGGAHRAGFQRFLRSIAAGEDPSLDALYRHLGTTAAELEAAFRLDLRLRTAALTAD